VLRLSDDRSARVGDRTQFVSADENDEASCLSTSGIRARAVESSNGLRHKVRALVSGKPPCAVGFSGSNRDLIPSDRRRADFGARLAYVEPPRKVEVRIAGAGSRT
jgi:hypothetical protein